MKTKLSTGSRVAILSLLTSLIGHAGVTIQISEVNGNVIAVANGSISSWSGLALGASGMGNNAAIASSSSWIGMGTQTPSWLADVHFGYTGSGGQWTAPGPFGSGTGFYYSTTSTGSFPFALNQNGFYINQGYTLGTAFDQVSTWESKTFSSLGLTEGVYDWTWAGDSAKVVIGNTVPEPSSVGLGGLALAAAVLRRRRSR